MDAVLATKSGGLNQTVTYIVSQQCITLRLLAGHWLTERGGLHDSGQGLIYIFEWCQCHMDGRVPNPRGVRYWRQIWGLSVTFLKGQLPGESPNANCIREAQTSLALRRRNLLVG